MRAPILFFFPAPLSITILFLFSLRHGCSRRGGDVVDVPDAAMVALVARIRCCSDMFEGGDSAAMVVRCLRSRWRCLRSRWRCSLHLVRRSRWRDDGGPHLDVRSRFAQVVDLCFCWLQVVGHGVSAAEAVAVKWCIAEKKTKLWWPKSLLPTRVAAAMVMERDDEN